MNHHVSSKCFLCNSLNYQGYINFLLKSVSFLIAVFSIHELEKRQIGEQAGAVLCQAQFKLGLAKTVFLDVDIVFVFPVLKI